MQTDYPRRGSYWSAMEFDGTIPVDIEANSSMNLSLPWSQISLMPFAVKIHRRDLNALSKMPQGTCLLSGTESVKHAIPVKIRERQ